MTISTPEASTSSAQVEARLERMRAHVKTIQTQLAKLVAWRAQRIGCARDEADTMLHDTTVAYFRALSRGEPPQNAIIAALDEGMLPVLTARIEAARAEGQPPTDAFRALIARIVDAHHPDHARIVSLAGAAFERSYSAGGSILEAVLQARAAARA